METDASENPTLWRYCGIALWELEMKEEATNALEFSLVLGDKSKKTNRIIAEYYREIGKEIEEKGTRGSGEGNEEIGSGRKEVSEKIGEGSKEKGDEVAKGQNREEQRIT